MTRLFVYIVDGYMFLDYGTQSSAIRVNSCAAIANEARRNGITFANVFFGAGVSREIALAVKAAMGNQA